MLPCCPYVNDYPRGASDPFIGHFQLLSAKIYGYQPTQGEDVEVQIDGTWRRVMFVGAQAGALYAVPLEPGVPTGSIVTDIRRLEVS